MSGFRPELLTGSTTRAAGRGRLLATLLVTALCASLIASQVAGLRIDTITDGAGALADRLGRVRWALVPFVGLMTMLHYLGSAAGLRAAADGVAGRRLGMLEITSAQFAGAAANRLAPSGVGSAAVTCRYLTRRGLPGGEVAATFAVATLARGVARLVLIVPAVVAWMWLGHDGPALDPGRLPWDRLPVLAAGVAIVVATVTLLAVLARRRRVGARIRAAWADSRGSLVRAMRRPRCLLRTLLAAVCADLTMALAFTVSVIAVTGTATPALGALPAVYVIGAAAGAVVPVPAGVGSTEAALVAALAVVHVPTAQAAQGVLLFRLMTFWAPVPAGVAGARRLRRCGAL